MTANDVEKKKKQVVIVYFTVFFAVFVVATIVAWQRRVDDARKAKEAAPISTATQVAPVPSR